MALGDGIRRNVATVSVVERSRLLNAILGLQSRRFPGSRDDHPPGGVTFWFKQDEIHQATHVHEGPAFLTWHRELCNRFEAMLREIDPAVSLHYWDWQVDPRHAPDSRGGFVDLFTSGFMGASGGSASEPWLSAGFYDPNANPFRSDQSFNPSDNPFDPPRTLDRAVGQALANPDGTPNLGGPDAAVIQADAYPTMRRVLEQMHNLAHGYIGGTLGNPHLSFRDPFVFLLHSNVDRLLALWQLQPGHPERLDPEQVYGSESGTVAEGRTVGILTPMEPWAGLGAPGSEAGVIAARPWAPPENEQLKPENQKNSKHPSVVTPPRYDTNPAPLPPPLPPRPGNGNFLQSTWGRQGNFELLVPQGPVINHYFRDNDAPGVPWHLITDQELRYPPGATVKSVHLIQSNFLGDGVHGNFEVVTRVALPGTTDGDHIDFSFIDSKERKWIGPFGLVAGATGEPAFIQSSFGRQGNFELLVPQGNVIRHWFRDNDAPGVPWHLITDQELHYPSGATVKSVRLIQSNFLGDGVHGNFEVVTRVALPGTTDGDHIDFSFIDSKERKWIGPFGLVAGATGEPAFIQSSFGRQGNFELLVPQGNVIRHWFRDNDAPGVPWHLITDQELRYPPGATVKSVHLIQSNFLGDGVHGNFEVVTRVALPGTTDGDHIDFSFIDSKERKWIGPFGLVAGATGEPAFIQSSFGRQGNFELLVPQGNVIRHWFRDNDAPGVPWHLITDQELHYPSGATVKSVRLIQSNFLGDGVHGNFEVVTRVALPGTTDGDHIDFSFIDSKERKWIGPFGLVAGATGEPAFIQSSFGRQGNFELLVPQGNV